MVKNELNSIFQLNEEINDLLHDIAREEEKATKATGTIDDMPKGSTTSDKVGNGATNIADLKEQYKEKIDLVKIQQGELLYRIYQIQDSRLRRILRERYINLRSLEEISIMIRLNYWDTTRYHNKALAEFEKTTRQHKQD